MKLSLIVPVYNEAQHLNEVVPFLYATQLQVEAEWIFIDDCSTDGSLDLLKKLAPQYGFKLLAQPTNQGKGAAVARGIKEATGDIIIIQDADFEYHPRDIPALIEPILKGEADVVFGSRFKKTAVQVHRTYHYFVNRFLTLVSNLFSGIYLTDMETCYKAFRADIVQSMVFQSKRFGIEVEMTAYLGKIRVRIHELPISYFPRTRLQGKKINWKDGVAALRHLVHFNFFTSREQAFKNLPTKYLA